MTLRDPLLTRGRLSQPVGASNSSAVARRKMTPMTRLRATLATLLLGATQFSACAAPAPADGPVVFAAASLRDVMQEVAALYAADASRPPVFNFAGSNALAQQLAAAPRGQVFLSADRRWVDELVRRGLVVEGSRRPLFSNRLVLIARAGAQQPDGSDCPTAPLSAAGARLALADPAAVPAGRYARAALESIPHAQDTLWGHIAPAATPTADVRATLALVESTPGLLGIVYRTDAASSSQVRVLCELATPPDRPIVYWAVRMRPAPGADPADSRQATSFLDFLAGDAARRVIQRHGFGPATS